MSASPIDSRKIGWWGINSTGVSVYHKNGCVLVPARSLEPCLRHGNQVSPSLKPHKLNMTTSKLKSANSGIGDTGTVRWCMRAALVKDQSKLVTVVITCIAVASEKMLTRQGVLGRHTGEPRGSLSGRFNRRDPDSLDMSESTRTVEKSVRFWSSKMTNCELIRRIQKHDQFLITDI